MRLGVMETTRHPPTSIPLARHSPPCDIRRRRTIGVCLTGIMNTLISGIVNYYTAAAFFFLFSFPLSRHPIAQILSGWKHQNAGKLWERKTSQTAANGKKIELVRLSFPAIPFFFPSPAAPLFPRSPTHIECLAVYQPLSCHIVSHSSNHTERRRRY